MRSYEMGLYFIAIYILERGGTKGRGGRKVGGGKREQQEKYCQTEIDTSLHSNLLQKKMLAPKKALWE